MNANLKLIIIRVQAQYDVEVRDRHDGTLDVHVAVDGQMCHSASVAYGRRNYVTMLACPDFNVAAVRGYGRAMQAVATLIELLDSVEGE